MLVPTRPWSFGHNYVIQRGAQSPTGQKETRRQRRNAIAEGKLSAHARLRWGGNVKSLFGKKADDDKKKENNAIISMYILNTAAAGVG